MACGNPLASFPCKNCPLSVPFACRGGDWPSFTSTGDGGGRPGPFGAVKLPPTPQTPKISTTTPPTRPMAGERLTPNFFISSLATIIHPGWKNLPFFWFFVLFRFSCENRLIRHLSSFLRGVFASRNTYFLWCVFDPKKFYCCERWGSPPRFLPTTPQPSKRHRQGPSSIIQRLAGK